MELRRLRKSIVTLFILLLFVIIEQFSLRKSEVKESNAVQATVQPLPSTFTFCTKVLNKRPINPIQSIEEKQSRIYFFAHSPLLERGQTEMIWYLNDKQMQTIGCSHPTRICYSSLAPYKLKSGIWSVDIMQGKKLLHTATLRVKPEQSF